MTEGGYRMLGNWLAVAGPSGGGRSPPASLTPLTRRGV